MWLVEEEEEEEVPFITTTFTKGRDKVTFYMMDTTVGQNLKALS